MDFKINQEIKHLLKMGLPEDMAFIVAHANNGKSEEVGTYITLIEQEQQMIKDELKNFAPLQKNIYIDVNKANDKNEIADIQH